jgi:hypothetical protein
MSKISGLSDDKMNRDKSRDTGMAFVLICLLVAYLGQRPRFALYAIILLVIDMVWPSFFYYPSKLWFGIAHLMGAVMSRVLLTVMFFVLVAPLGLLRRLGGADAMQLKQWKKGTASVFKTRDHTYTGSDVEHPY